jgi:hypothetical protein
MEFSHTEGLFLKGAPLGESLQERHRECAQEAWCDGGGVSRGESPAVGLGTLCNNVNVSVWRIRYRDKRDGVC